MTLRAIEVLKAADLIACEDTRHSKVLLDHYGIRKPLVSYHDFSEKRRAPELLDKIKNGAKVALISDAGTPGIADPGYRLVKGAIEAGVRIESIPGPSAFLAALAVSGLPTDRFIFEGFFPIKSGQKKTKLLSLRNEERTIIFYESPHRILKTLETVRETLGDIHIVVARELTKKFEEVVRDQVSNVVEYFSGKKILGEFVVMFNLSQ
jgi:16S rRNA (cytidine1402-2'-O)-methyltransferase